MVRAFRAAGVKLLLCGWAGPRSGVAVALSDELMHSRLEAICAGVSLRLESLNPDHIVRQVELVEARPTVAADSAQLRLLIRLCSCVVIAPEHVASWYGLAREKWDCLTSTFN